VARAQPWAQRPVVSLWFDVSADRAVVQGRESVRFIPDRRVCELVFRAWPNKPETARRGNRMTVTSVTVDGVAVAPRVSAAGAPAGVPGTLLRVPLAGCVAAGTEVNAALRFRLVLGANTPERVGYRPGEGPAWFATAFPLLAWERGNGWMTSPAVSQFGEAAGSEEFKLASLEVVAPHADAVLGTGQALGARAGPRPGTRLHRFEAESVRDVAVAVGPLRVVTRTVAEVRVHVGASAAGTVTPLETWASLVAGSVTRLSALLGPFPYQDLWVAVLPGVPTGIEFPGAVQYGDVDPVRFRALVSHELAHMYFYGLVGNDQGRDPWLDESFASYAQAVVDDDEDSHLFQPVPPAVRGRMGEPMAFWDGKPAPVYSGGVYLQGARALLAGRRAEGADRFDAAIRDYVNANAHRIAVPADVQAAMKGLPKAGQLLREAGAFARTR
jgi:hypothetical protein